MRNACIETILEEAKKNPNIILLTGDLGYGVLKKYIEEVPNQFINCGISEQNMLSIAGGLSSLGKIVIIYSIGNFPTLRALEQVRNDICYPNNDVKIICVGGGYTYGTFGMSHHTLEDVAILKTLPNMHIYTPCDKNETKLVTLEALNNKSPSYIRLERDNETIINLKPSSVEKPQHLIKNDSNVAIFSYGTIINEAIEASKEIKINVYSVPRIKPLENDFYLKILKKYKTIVTLEEHTVIGGLGDSLASLISANGLNVKLIKMGVNDEFSLTYAKQEVLRKINHIDKEALLSILKQK